MALQTSGAISLNDIHIELGETSGTTVSLNDTDVRGLVSIASGAIDLADFYGASAQAFSTTTIGITEGDDTYPAGLTTDIDHTTALELSTQQQQVSRYLVSLTRFTPRLGVRMRRATPRYQAHLAFGCILLTLVMAR